jgi:hypothetical protein
MKAEIELYEALVDAGVSKDKARNVMPRKRIPWTSS